MLTLASQMWEDRSPSNHILLAHYPICPNCPRPKVRCFFVNLNTPVLILLPWQNLRDNEEEQIDRRDPVFNCHRAVWPRIIHDHLEFSEPGSRFLPCHIYVRAPGLTKCFPAVVPPVKLPAFQICSVKGRTAFTIPQVTLSLVFGGYFVTLNHPLHFLRRPTWPFK